MKLYACMVCRWPLRLLEPVDACPKCEHKELLALGETDVSNKKRLDALVDERWLAAWIVHQEEQTRIAEELAFKKRFRNRVVVSVGIWIEKGVYLGELSACYKAFDALKSIKVHGWVELRDHEGTVLERADFEVPEIPDDMPDYMTEPFYDYNY